MGRMACLLLFKGCLEHRRAIRSALDQRQRGLQVGGLEADRAVDAGVSTAPLGCQLYQHLLVGCKVQLGVTHLDTWAMSGGTIVAQLGSVRTRPRMCVGPLAMYLSCWPMNRRRTSLTLGSILALCWSSGPSRSGSAGGRGSPLASPLAVGEGASRSTYSRPSSSRLSRMPLSASGVSLGPVLMSSSTSRLRSCSCSRYS